jgi:integrase/recombinase XerD
LRAVEELTGVSNAYIRQAGIEVEGSCHLFRHAMATHMLENGADIRFIQAMLEHEDLSATEIYTHVSIEKLRQIHAATHPARLERSKNPSETRPNAEATRPILLDGEAETEEI